MSQPPTSESFHVLWALYFTEPFILDDPLEVYVASAAFDEQCFAAARSELTDDESEYMSDRSRLWETDPSESSSSPYDVPNIEAHLYYYGIRGERRWPPKLVFRTSKDVFPGISKLKWGQDFRRMRLLPVYEHQTLGNDNRWVTIRAKV